MKNYFFELARSIDRHLKPPEQYSAWFSAEEMHYVRFNQARCRQAGSVWQHKLSIDLIEGLRHARMTLTLTKCPKTDEALIASALTTLRGYLKGSAEDPYLLINSQPQPSEHVGNVYKCSKEEIVDTILETTQGLDFVGSYIGGPMYRGYAQSSGQRNWFEKSSFVIDWSLCHSGDKAVKQNYSGENFDKLAFKNKIEEGKQGLALLAQKTQSIAKGSYRVYFSPAAVYELLSMLNWCGFSRSALETKTSPLGPLYQNSKTLSPQFTLTENMQNSVGPNFQAQGFLKPEQLMLIEQGRLKNTLISPKTAKEYGLSHNGADANETMVSMDLAAGTLAHPDILSTLDTGLFINNLWYLNFSDRQNGCMTGMTRFLCYTVKDGQPKFPFSVMRFDDSIYRFFGENLVTLTNFRELLIDNSTYDERATNCAMLPGIIADDVRFTL